MAAERVGINSLANEYKKLGTDRHRNELCRCWRRNPFRSRTLPLRRGFSFNSLDHVRPGARDRRIKRIVKPGGLFLLLTEVNHAATATEPQCFSFDVVGRTAVRRALGPQVRDGRGGHVSVARRWQPLRGLGSHAARRAVPEVRASAVPAGRPAPPRLGEGEQRAGKTHCAMPSRASASASLAMLSAWSAGLVQRVPSSRSV